MNPEQDNQEPYNSPLDPADNSAAYLQEIQQIVNPINPNPAAPGQPVPTTGQPRLIKLANLIGNISLIAWLFPIIGLLVAVVALILALKTKKFGDKRANIRPIIAIIGLVLSPVCTGAVGYLAYDKWQKNDDTSSLATYPTEARTEYLEGCSIVFDEATCNCMLNGFETTYTIDEYLDQNERVYDGTASDDYYLFLRDNQLACQATTEPTTTPTPTIVTE
jgi:hypothetical protein